jgi:hypothetical protein
MLVEFRRHIQSPSYGPAVIVSERASAEKVGEKLVRLSTLRVQHGRLAGKMSRATRAYSTGGFASTISAQTSNTSRPKASPAASSDRSAWPERYPNPLARQLHTEGLSYRKISAALAERGHVTANGKPHAASAIQKMLGR